MPCWPNASMHQGIPARSIRCPMSSSSGTRTASSARVSAAYRLCTVGTYSCLALATRLLSGHMSSPVVTAPRRHLRPRQADTIQKLLTSAVAVVETTGYEGLTIRGVAQRANVAPATAYTYFASKDHLLAEVFWQRLQTWPQTPIDQRRSAPDRVALVTRDLAMLVADEPALAGAVTTALLAHDPDVKQLRDQMGAVFVQRLEAALGKDAIPELINALTLVLTGAMLMAGMGNLDYRDLPERMAQATALMTGTRRRSR